MMSLENTTAKTTTIRPPHYTQAPDNSVIDQASQEAINFVLWGASGLALFILFIRLIISIIHRIRRRNSEGVPFCADNSRCTLQEDPPPNYSQLSIRTLPPTYSQGCRIIHYHPSTGNTSQQTVANASNGNDLFVNEAYSNYSSDVDFTVPPSSDNPSANNECGNNASNVPSNCQFDNIIESQEHLTNMDDNDSDTILSRTNNENDRTIISDTNENVVGSNDTNISTRTYSTTAV